MDLRPAPRPRVDAGPLALGQPISQRVVAPVTGRMETTSPGVKAPGSGGCHDQDPGSQAPPLWCGGGSRTGRGCARRRRTTCLTPRSHPPGTTGYGAGHNYPPPLRTPLHRGAYRAPPTTGTGAQARSNHHTHRCTGTPNTTTLSTEAQTQRYTAPHHTAMASSNHEISN